MSKRLKFLHQPVGILDTAMSIYLGKSLDLPPQLLVHRDDIKTLEGIPAKVLPWATIYETPTATYYLNWYLETYETISAVKIKNKTVIGIKELVLQYITHALNKKNKVPRAIAKKYLANSIELINLKLI